MENTTEYPQEHKDENILKPKRTRTMTEDAKKQYAERMKKVNEDRCAKARIANEAVLEAKEKEIQMKNQARLDLIAKKKEQIKLARDKKEPIQPTQHPHHQEEKKKRTKKVILEDLSSEESTDYMDDDDEDSDSSEEIVYVAKKSKKPKKEEKKQKERATSSLVKEKKQVYHRDIPIPIAQEANKTIIKFI